MDNMQTEGSLSVKNPTVTCETQGPCDVSLGLDKGTLSTRLWKIVLLVAETTSLYFNKFCAQNN